MLEPASYEEAAELLKASGEVARAIRPVGGGTKLAWGAAGRADLDLSTASLTAIREHNAGDLTAVLEAGARLAHVQDVFAEAGQMLALDPPLGAGDAATIGGIVATADSGPLRHRYGAPRDLVIGITVALSDGTVAKSGGKVIKNVAGYDLGKLFAGSFGTLGLILGVAVRLHPRPATRATALFRGDSPDALATTAASLAHAPLELEALDVRWEPGRGAVFARAAGAAAIDRAGSMVERWAARSLRRTMLFGRRNAPASARKTGSSFASRRYRRGSAGCSRWPRAQAPGSSGGRGSELPGWRFRTPPRSPRYAASSAGSSSTVLPASSSGVGARTTRRWLMRRVKERFDPAGILNPGVFAGGDLV